MPAEQENFQNMVDELLEVAMFENWLRFYFIRETPDKNDTLFIELPEKSLKRIKELYPGLLPLAEKLNNKEITFETSQLAVLEHILQQMDGKTLEKGRAQQILQSRTFQTKLQMFHTWVQMHEDQLDQGFMEFGVWRNLFAQWLDTPGARELENKLFKQG